MCVCVCVRVYVCVCSRVYVCVCVGGGNSGRLVLLDVTVNNFAIWLFVTEC